MSHPRLSRRRNILVRPGGLACDALIERIEPRVLMSASGTTTFYPDYVRKSPVTLDGGGSVAPAGSTTESAVGGLSVAQVRGAYGLGSGTSSSITFSGLNGTVVGDGSGQIIAVVDAYNDPDIATDLATFDTAFGLPAPASFTVVGQTGSTTSLPANGATSGNNDWSGEESLDVEWAHAIAPGAGILVVECTSSSGNYLEEGDAVAAAYPGVSVVSNSYGGGESGGETSIDSDFTTPAGHAGVSFFASAGDSGGEVSYPAESPNVVAVGGTQLTVSGNSYSSESAWSDTGGGTSTVESQPSFQAGTVSSSKRETPDISIAGGQNSGNSNSYVPVVDSYDQSASAPWVGVEGTSWSSPMVAAMVAIADQGRVAEGLPTLSTVTGSNQVDTRLYQLSSASFHDITTGSNGHSAVAGYDEASGIGTPVGNVLIPDLAGAATITGRVFDDNTGTGVYGGTDTPVAGQVVYLDLNNDGKLDNGDPSATTNAMGVYTFTDQVAGGSVRLSSTAPAGYALESSSSATISYGPTDTANFTYKAVASKVAFAQQPPASVALGATISPIVVDVENAIGTVAGQDGSTVTLTLNHGTFNTGSSTVTVAAVNGVATFSGLSINSAGTYSLIATDAALTAGTSTSLTVNQATPSVSWQAPASITYGTPLGAAQLDATANVPGTFTYTPAAGTILTAGSAQPLSVLFTPTDSTDYTTAGKSSSITVTQATPVITWQNPASITYGTPLGAAQLDANASVPGTFVYTPPAGTVLNTGPGQVLDTTFTPSDSADYTVASATAAITVVGYTAQPVNLAGSAFYLRRDAGNPALLDIWTNATASGSPAVSTAFAGVSSIDLSGYTSGATVVADFSNGTVDPAGGLTFDAAGPASGNSLTVVGTGGGDTVTAPGAGSLTLNGQAVGYATAGTIGAVYFQSPGSGESLNVPSGTVTLAPGTTGAIATEAFTNLTIGPGAEIAVATAATPAQRVLVQTGTLGIAGGTGNWTGTLDLSDNDMDVTGGSLAVVNSQIAQGVSPAGTGGGIISSAARNDSTHLTTLGVIQNSPKGTTAGRLWGTNTALGLFDGANPAAGDVLVRYTWFGDANLDGQVDGSDYSSIDAGYSSGGALTGWVNGDFNYDGAIDGTDYALIDNAFDNQGTAVPAAQAAASTAVVESDIVTSAGTSAPTVVAPKQTSRPPVAAGVFNSGQTLASSASTFDDLLKKARRTASDLLP
jgi:hypothetical protein